MAPSEASSESEDSPTVRRTTPRLFRDRRLLGLLAAAALLRLFVGLDVAENDPLARVPISDAAYYDLWARTLACGEDWRPGEAYWLPPLYPHLLVLAAPAIPYDPPASLAEGHRHVFLLQALVGLVTTLVLVALSDRLAGRGPALAAGWLWTLYAPVAFFETRLLAVNAALLPSALALALALRAAEGLRAGRRPWISALGAGLAAGVAALARPNLLLAAPCVALAWLVAARRRERGSDVADGPARERTDGSADRPAGGPAAGPAARPTSASAGRRGSMARALAASLALAVGLAAGVAPAAVRNWNEAGALVPVTANGGINFWFGNNEHARGTFHAPGPEWNSIRAQRETSIELASRAEGRALDETEASRHWFARGRAWLLGHPLDALRLWAVKLADTLSSTEFGIQYSVAKTRLEARSLWIAALPFGLLLALGVVGWSGRLPGRATLIGWLAAGVASSLLYFTYSRFRLPILLAWMPFAGRGALRVLRGPAGWREVPRTTWVLAAVALAQSFVPFEGDYPDRLLAHALVDGAAAWETLGEPERGLALVERSLELQDTWRGRYQRARLELARGSRGSQRRAHELLSAIEGNPENGFEVALELAALEATAVEPEVRDPRRAVERLRELAADEGLTAARRELVLRTLLRVLKDDPELELGDGERERLQAELERLEVFDLPQPAIWRGCFF